MGSDEEYFANNITFVLILTNIQEILCQNKPMQKSEPSPSNPGNYEQTALKKRPRILKQ